jgi:hypothetical protein
MAFPKALGKHPAAGLRERRRTRRFALQSRVVPGTGCAMQTARIGVSADAISRYFVEDLK